MKWQGMLAGKARAALVAVIVAAVAALATALGAGPEVVDALRVVLRAALGLFGSS